MTELPFRLVFGHVVTSGRTNHYGAYNLWSVCSTAAIRWRAHCHSSVVAVYVLTPQTFCRVLYVDAVNSYLRGCKIVYNPVPRRSHRTAGWRRCFPISLPALHFDTWKDFDSTATLVQKVADVLIVGIIGAPQWWRRYLKVRSRSLNRKAVGTWGLLGMKVHWKGCPMRLSYFIVSSILPTGRHVPVHRQLSSLPFV